MFYLHYREINMPATFDDLCERRFEKTMMNANVGALRIATLSQSQVEDLCQKSETLLQWMNASNKEVGVPQVSF